MRFLLTSYPMWCSRGAVPSSEVQKRCSVPFSMLSVVGLSCKFQFKHVVWYLPSFGEDNVKMTTYLELQQSLISFVKTLVTLRPLQCSFTYFPFAKKVARHQH